MKIGLISLGCPKNLVDSEVMLGLARQAGHELTQDASQADVLVVNTCAFIDSAKQESVNTILEMARHKKDGACQRLIVTGCLAERYREELAGGDAGDRRGARHRRSAGNRPRNSGTPRRCRRSLFTVALGPHPQRERDADAIAAASHAPRALRTHWRQAPGTRGLPTYIYDADTPRSLATPRHYAYVKIAEGCDYKCAFCIIPTLRGHYRSRPAASIVQEARALAARGVKELLLISQDTTFYGIDRQERGALARLLRELNTVDGLEWIRLLYLYPTTIDDETLAAMAECDKVCKYIDLPLQHASNAGAQTHEAPRHAPELRPAARPHPRVACRASRCGRRLSSDFPARREDDLDELRAVRDRPRVRPRRRVHVFARRRHVGATPSTTTCRRGIKTVRRNRLMGLQKRLVSQAQPEPDGRAGAGGRRRSVGRSRADPAGRAWPRQAPDIDASVYLTECDPSSYRAGRFCRGGDRRGPGLRPHRPPAHRAIILDCLGVGPSGRVPTFFVSGRRSGHLSWRTMAAVRRRRTGDRTIATRVAGSYGLDIFDVQYRREGPGMVLRIQIDRPGTDVWTSARRPRGGRQRRGLRARQPRSERRAGCRGRHADGVHVGGFIARAGPSRCATRPITAASRDGGPSW